MLLKCYKCQHQWNYKGKSRKKNSLTCANQKCRYKIVFEKAKENYEINNIAPKEPTNQLIQKKPPKKLQQKKTGWGITQAPNGEKIIFEDFGDSIQIKQVGFKKLEEIDSNQNSLLQKDNTLTTTQQLQQTNPQKPKPKKKIVILTEKDFHNLPNLCAEHNLPTRYDIESKEWVCSKCLEIETKIPFQEKGREVIIKRVSAPKGIKIIPFDKINDF